jgi:aminopeptidase N
MDQSVRKPKLLKDYAPPAYLIEEVELDVALDPKATRVASKLRLRGNPKVATGCVPLVLDGEALTLQSITLNGKRLSPAEYALTDSSLTIATVPAQPFTLEIVTLCDPEANTALSGLYRSSGTYCTQCEPEGFRRITYFIDRPDVLAVYTVRVEADRTETPILLANGNPIAQGEIEGTGRHFAIWHDPFPKPTYLRAGWRRSRLRVRSLRHRVRPRGRAQYLCRARQAGSLCLGHGVAQTRHALGRGAVRPRIRSRRLQYRRGQRLQHGGDGE